MTQTALELRGVNKSFAGVDAIQDLDLEVPEGEILALVGPSGCGKTTLLRLIAGFETPDRGTITLRERIVVNGPHCLPPEQRGVGMVFQDYALFPHLTVAGNVGFGLQHLRDGQRGEVVQRMLELVGLLGSAERMPHELSGGERQRVALARAMAPEPVIILLDEPFSNLDADRRIQMRQEVRSILKKVGATAILVTHDQEEALYFGDRLAVLREGRIQQVGTPEEIFHRPASRSVADFMGQTEFLPGTVTPTGIETEIGIVRQQVDLPDGSRVELAVRADDVEIVPSAGGGGVIQERQFKGALNLYKVALPSGQVLHSLQPHTRILSAGTVVDVRIDPGHPLACFLDGKAVPDPGAGLISPQ
jgi:iron(III) transport system ATP-binding protein